MDYEEEQQIYSPIIRPTVKNLYGGYDVVSEDDLYKSGTGLGIGADAAITTQLTELPKVAAYTPGLANNTSKPAETTNSYVDFLKEQGLTGNAQIDYANSAGLGGLTQGTWNNLGQAAGLAGNMYNMYDSLLGNKADLYKEQIGNLKDQRAYNAQTIANQKKFKENIGSGFSGAFSNGLAASRVG